MTASPTAARASGTDGPSSAASLDSRAINGSSPETLTAELTRILAGPPGAAAATLRAAAEGGVILAQLVYGQWLLDGHGVSRDPAQAMRWFDHASRDGDPMALNMLGQCHAHGWGVARNPFMAAYWFRLSALGGLDWGMYNYATALALGQGIPQDRAAALDWFHRAAALGHAKSMNMIGGFHEDGWIVDRDEDAALDWYLRAAAGGDFRGQFNAARVLLFQGRPEEALAWLRRVPESATPAFLRQAASWLRSSLTPGGHLAGTLDPETVAHLSRMHPHWTSPC